MTFNSRAQSSPDRIDAASTDEHRREDARVRLRPEGVVFASRSGATNDTSFAVGKFRRTRDATILIEAKKGEISRLTSDVPEANRGAMRKRTTSPGGRLMDLRTAAAYLGCSYWTLRDLVLNGHIPAVRIPSPRARDGRVMRRILIDSRDLERLIERWKEVDTSQLHP